MRSQVLYWAAQVTDRLPAHNNHCTYSISSLNHAAEVDSQVQVLRFSSFSCHPVPYAYAVCMPLLAVQCRDVFLCCAQSRELSPSSSADVSMVSEVVLHKCMQSGRAIWPTGG